MKRYSGYVMLFFVVLLFSSCAKRQVILVPLEPIEGPVTVESLKAGRFFGGIGSLRSEVSLAVFRNGGKIAGLSGALAYMSPGSLRPVAGSLRLRAYDPFGYIVLDIVMEGGNVQVYVPGANTLFEGSLDLLDAPETHYRMEAAGDGYVLYASGRDGHISRVYRFDARLRNRVVEGATGPNAKEATGPGDKEATLKAVVEFGEFSGRLPMSIVISLSNGYSLKAKLKETEVGALDAPDASDGPDVSDAEEIFAPLSPSGVMTMPLDRIMNLR